MLPWQVKELSPKVPVAVYLPYDLLQRLDKFVGGKGVSRNAAIEEAIARMLDAEGGGRDVEAQPSANDPPNAD